MTRLVLAAALAAGALVPVSASASAQCWPLSCCPPVALDECPDGCRVILREGPVVFCVEQHA